MQTPRKRNIKVSIIDLSRQEVQVPFVIAVIFTLVFSFFLLTNSIVSVTTIIQTVSLAVAVGLVGVLGLLISGLAIITSTIKNEIIHQMDKNETYNSLQAILDNFKYLGKIIGYTSISFFITYFIVSINIETVLLFLVIPAFILSFLLFYIIFAAIDLLGTCNEIFEINYTYYKASTKNDELRKVFDDLRINYLTKVLYENSSLTKEKFVNDLLELSDSLYGNVEIDRNDLKNYIKSYYGFDC